MNFLGLDIKRASPKLRPGGNFEARSLVNQVRSAAPHLPVIPSYTNENVPMTTGGFSERLEDRAIQSDPRENWYLTLPEKITPQQAVNIIRAAAGGDIWQQHMLLQLMEGRWPTFRKAAHELREAASYVKYQAHPYCEEGEKPSESAKEKAGLISRAMKAFSPNQYTDESGCTGMLYDFSHALLLGLSCQEMIWQQVKHPKHGLEWMPRASCFVHPRHFTYSNTGTLCVFDQDYDRLYNDPRTQTRNPILWNTTPNPDKFIFSQFKSKSGSALTAGFMLPLIWLFVARQWCSEWALNTAKQFGSPFIDITYRPGSSDDDERSKLLAFLKNAGAERKLIHPEGTIATIEQASTMTADNPQRWLYDESDRQCLFLLLGQTGTTQATPGKLGESGTHEGVKRDRVMGLADWTAHNPLRQFARAVLRLNYGNDSECPEILPDKTETLSVTESSSLITSANSSGMPFRADEMYKRLGFTQPEPGDIVLQRGEIAEMLTEEEQHAKAIEMQQEQIALQQQAQAGPKADGADDTEPVTAKELAGLGDAELNQLEFAVTAAERAPHLNGELETVLKITKRK